MAQTAKKRRYEFDAYVFHRGTYWYAECPDLSLITRRTTPKAALIALAEQVQLYIGTRLAAGEGHLIPRPSAPLYQQAEQERQDTQAAQKQQRHTTLTYEGGTVAYM